MKNDPRDFFNKEIVDQEPTPAKFQTLIELCWKAYGEQVFLFSYARLGNLEDARDVCQDTFVHALEWFTKHYEQIPTKVNFAAWLKRIARNLIIDRFCRNLFTLRKSLIVIFLWPCELNLN